MIIFCSTFGHTRPSRDRIETTTIDQHGGQADTTFQPMATPSTYPALAARDNNYDGGIYICSGTKWTGTCFWQSIPRSAYGKCANVTSKDGWRSVGPDKHIAVGVYKDMNCKGDLLKEWMIFPGSTDMGAAAASQSFSVIVRAYKGNQKA